MKRKWLRKRRNAGSKTASAAESKARGWQKDARFRYAVCGRRFAKNLSRRRRNVLGLQACRRAQRASGQRDLVRRANLQGRQAKRVMWNRLKRNIPEDRIQGRPNNTECVMQMRTGHVMRVVGLDDPDALRGSGLWFFMGR